jgi:membrane-bound ClpP family serine protease
VYAGGEEWTARSDALIPAGSQVKVVGREGVVLKVVKAE